MFHSSLYVQKVCEVIPSQVKSLKSHFLKPFMFIKCRCLCILSKNIFNTTISTLCTGCCMQWCGSDSVREWPERKERKTSCDLHRIRQHVLQYTDSGFQQKIRVKWNSLVYSSAFIFKKEKWLYKREVIKTTDHKIFNGFEWLFCILTNNNIS